MMEKLIPAIRILLGMVYALNGLNWFFKIITPYPSISDFVDYMPPPDLVGALIENGILFHLAKGVELVGGIALLANRMVPLALVVSMAVTVMVFIVDVFKPEFRLRAFLMGTGSFAMNTVLLLAYYHHYRPMMAWKAQPTADPSVPAPADGGEVAEWVGRLAKWVFAPLAIVSLLIGIVIVVWLWVMVFQYIADPKAIHEVREMVPRSHGA